MNRQIIQVDKQRLYIKIMTICLVVAVLVTYGGFISMAKSKEPDKTVYKYYKSIQIQSGDTLWDLANKYITREYETISDYIEEVKYINSLKDDNIHEGQYLMLPYYSNKVLY